MIHEKYENDLNIISNARTVYIYGAGDVSREVYFCLSSKTFCVDVSAFLVSSISDVTPEEIENVPVMKYDDKRVDKDAVVILAVLEKYRDEICETLNSIGIENRILLTFESDLWSLTRSRLFEQVCLEKRYPYLFRFDFTNNEIPDADNTNLMVYVTRSTKDKPLKTNFPKRPWEEEILAGAALDSLECEYVRDDEGDNISNKNRKFCELTVMYWIWKNRDSDYVGLSHYRRRFDFTEDEIKKIVAEGFDAILTVPMINVPNVRYMYGKNHYIDDWIKMIDVVNKISPEYGRDIEVVEQSNYYIPYNMFIMKRNVFIKYCEWLFPILEGCESLIGDYDDVYQNRYIGFLAERLMTAYFYHHRDNMKIMICNKHFLE